METGQRAARVIAEIVVALHFAATTAAAIARHLRVETSIFDLGLFNQVVWNTVHGRWFESSVEVRHALGEHFSPILALLAPLHMAWPGPMMLLVVQAAVVSLSGLAAYALAAYWTRGPWLALAILVGYLFHPSLIDMVLFDFHPDALLTAFMVMAAWAIVRRHHVLAVLLLLLMLACKEDAGIAVLGLGLLCLLAWRRPWTGAALVVLGPTAVLVTGMWAVAHFRNAPPATLDRYVHLGRTGGEIAGELARHPVRYAIGREHGVLRNPRRGAIVDLLLPSGGLVLCTPAAVAMIPAILPHTLSGFPDQYLFVSQYGAIAVPLLTLVSIDGGRRLRRFVLRRARRGRPTARIALASAAAVLIVGACAINHGKWYHRRVAPLWSPQAAIRVESVRRVSPRVPDDAPLLCSNSLGPQFANRRWLQCLRPDGPLPWFPRIAPHPSAPLPTYVLVDLQTCWRFGGMPVEQVDAALIPVGFDRIAASGPIALYKLEGHPAVNP